MGISVFESSVSTKNFSKTSSIISALKITCADKERPGAICSGALHSTLKRNFG
jgi:hypothetical protein